MTTPWTTDVPTGGQLPGAPRWQGPPFPAPAPAGPIPEPASVPPAVLEAVVVGPGDTLGLRIAPGAAADMDEAAARIFADVRKYRPELEGRVLVVAAEQVFTVRATEPQDRA